MPLTDSHRRYHLSRFPLLRNVGVSAVCCEDGEHLNGHLAMGAYGVRDHGRELGRTSRLNDDESVSESEFGSSGKHGKPVAPWVHTRLFRAGSTGGDPHFCHGQAVRGAVAGERPHCHPAQVVMMGADDDVSIIRKLYELIQAGVERSSYGNELIKGDSTRTRFDPAEVRRTEEASCCEGVQGPPSGAPQCPDSLPN